MSANKDKYLTVRISPELADRLNNAFEWGEKGRVIENVLDWTVRMVETHGPVVLGLFLRSDPAEVMRLDLIKELENGNSRKS